MVVFSYKEALDFLFIEVDLKKNSELLLNNPKHASTSEIWPWS